MIRISTLGFALALLALAAGAAVADEQPKSGVAMASKADSAWSPVDYNFVAQANLGAPFQIASGRIAEEKATTANIRDYAHLMVVSHIPVVDALDEILRHEGAMAPPNTLLQGAYDAMIASLKADRARTFDRNYVEGQVDYQKGNAALFRYEIQNGADPNLKEFAQRTLPKIEDHLQRALKLAKSAEIARASSQ
jgi:putative membrane protein